MNMSSGLPLFSVRLALHEVDALSDPDATQKIRNELSMRSHIRTSMVSWANAQKREIIVYVEVEGLEPISTGNDAAEELFEICCAVLKRLEGLHIDIIEVTQLKE